MISDQDLTKLHDTLVSKEELADLRLEVGELKDIVVNMDVKLDRFLGTIDTLRNEEAAGAVTLERHTRQIKSLASHVGSVLPD